MKSYLMAYDRHLTRFAGKPITIIEFGISKGGSLQIWRKLFGPQARIIGIDLNPDCLALSGDAEIIIGRQEDDEMLRALPDPDIIIDDASHKPYDQIATFVNMWPKLKWGGIYAVEDLKAYSGPLLEMMIKSIVGEFGSKNRDPGCPLYIYPDIVIAEKIPLKRWSMIEAGRLEDRPETSLVSLKAQEEEFKTGTR